jgi:hypothetical protein
MALAAPHTRALIVAGGALFFFLLGALIVGLT